MTPHAESERARLGIQVKSYAGDISRAKKLATSLATFNVDGLPIWFVVPTEDQEQFTPLAQECDATALSEDLGVIINSNFSKSWGQIDEHESKASTLARYVSWPILFQTTKLKFIQGTRQRFHHETNEK